MRSRAALPPARNAAIGLILGILLWFGIGPFYQRALVALTNATLSATGSGISIVRQGPAYNLYRGSERAGDLRPAYLTFNIIVLFALFCGTRVPWSRVNLRRFTLALMALIAVHVLAIIATAQSVVAMGDPRSGMWALNFWFFLAQGYAVVGAYALVFALWWLLRPSAKLTRYI